MSKNDCIKDLHFNETTFVAEDISTFVEIEQGTYRIDAPINENQILAMAQTIIGKRFKKEHQMTQPDLLVNYLSLHFGTLEQEVFFTIFLDNAHYILHSEILFRGSLHAIEIYPREIAKLIFKYNAAAVLFAHNHPSGTCLFSEEDIKTTQFLQKGLKFLDVRLLDHLVIAGNHFRSMKAMGILE